MNTRFLIAKYAPDVARMEPRNVGVVVWHAGHVATKFLAPEAARFVEKETRPNFSRWVSFWERQARAEFLERHRKSVPRANPSFLDALLIHQEENYILDDAGVVMDPVTPGELPEVAEFLFAELVAGKGKPASDRDLSLSEACETVFQEAGVATRLRRKYPVRTRVLGVEKRIEFSHGIPNGRPQNPDALFQALHLDRDRPVFDAATKFRGATEGGVIDPVHCGVLVLTGREGAHARRASENRRIIEGLGITIIDTADPPAAAERLRETVRGLD